MKFCPKCGKTVSVLYHDLCRECSAESVELFTCSQKDVTICRECETIQEGLKRYKESDLKKSIETVLKQRIKPTKNLKSSHVEVDFKMPVSHRKRDKIKTTAKIHLKGTADGKVPIEDDFELPVTMRYILCEKCSKMNTQYFEGILQIRHPDRKKIDRVLELLDKIMEDENKRSVFVTDKEDVKGGVDAYVTSQKHIKEIGKRLFDIVGGEIKINEQLFSFNNQTSKNLYRVNVLLRLPDFDQGSVIHITDNMSKDKIIQIKKMKGYFMMGRDLIWNKDVSMNYKECEIDVIANKEDFMSTTVTKVRPEIEVLNPVTYESDKVQNAKHLPEHKIGDKVDVFIYKKGVWII